MSPLESARATVERGRRGVRVARALLELAQAAKAIRHHAPTCPATFARPCTCGLSKLREALGRADEQGE